MTKKDLPYASLKIKCIDNANNNKKNTQNYKIKY
jgi:hypothetical protein